MLHLLLNELGLEIGDGLEEDLPDLGDVVFAHVGAVFHEPAVVVVFDHGVVALFLLDLDREVDSPEGFEGARCVLEQVELVET